jgi:hypothetical protein
MEVSDENINASGLFTMRQKRILGIQRWYWKYFQNIPN